MAGVTQTESLALAALARLLGEPMPKVLHGSKTSPGIFSTASAADKAAARFCLDHGWLAPTGDAVGKGKTRKELYRLAPAGLQAVLTSSDLSALLRSLADSLKRFDAVPAALQEMKTALSKTLERIQPIDVEALSKKLAGDSSAPVPPRTETDWGEDVVKMAAEQKQRNPLQRLTLPQVFERLRSKHPELTLAQFHDGLRRLHDQKRIFLGGYTQALATLEEARNALFLDREVKYYVEPPRG